MLQAQIKPHFLTSISCREQGLFIVSERIKSFYGGGARMELESELGKGTRLTMIISSSAVVYD